MHLSIFMNVIEEYLLDITINITFYTFLRIVCILRAFAFSNFPRINKNLACHSCNDNFVDCSTNEFPRYLPVNSTEIDHTNTFLSLSSEFAAGTEFFVLTRGGWDGLLKLQRTPAKY